MGKVIMDKMLTAIDLTCPVKDVTQSHAGRSLKHSQAVDDIRPNENNLLQCIIYLPTAFLASPCALKSGHVPAILVGCLRTTQDSSEICHFFPSLPSTSLPFYLSYLKHASEAMRFGWLSLEYAAHPSQCQLICPTAEMCFKRILPQQPPVSYRRTLLDFKSRECSQPSVTSNMSLCVICIYLHPR